MKKKLVLFAAFVVFSMASNVNAQPTPPASGGNGGSSTAMGGASGGGAPIDGGISILLALGAAYGARKVYVLKKVNEK